MSHSIEYKCLNREPIICEHGKRNNNRKTTDWKDHCDQPDERLCCLRVQIKLQNVPFAYNTVNFVLSPILSLSFAPRIQSCHLQERKVNI